jgi:hypothetical protein
MADPKPADPKPDPAGKPETYASLADWSADQLWLLYTGLGPQQQATMRTVLEENYPDSYAKIAPQLAPQMQWPPEGIIVRPDTPLPQAPPLSPGRNPPQASQASQAPPAPKKG